MNRFGLCLLASLLSCSAALVAGARESIAQTLSQTAQQENINFKKQYEQAKADFNDVRKARDYADYTLSCQNQKLAHVIAFNEFQRQALEKRGDELAQKSLDQEKMLGEKNQQLSHLFGEISTIRTMLHESLAARNNLEKAYLNLDKKFRQTQHNFVTKTKQLSDKMIQSEVLRQASLAGEGKAVQRVALLSQALRENEKFYTQDVNKIFDELAYELETTRSQLALAADACEETEHEATMLKQQLEMTQKLLGKQGFSAKSEKDLKALQLAINKLGKQTTEGKSSYYQQLSQALDHIQKLDHKLDKAQQDLAKNEVAMMNKLAAESKSQQDIKILNSELSRIKREYQSNLAQNNLKSAQGLKALDAELFKTKHSFERMRKTLNAKDLAFGVLEKHCKTLQTALNKEHETQKLLVENLREKESALKQTQAKLARTEITEHNLRALTKKAQAELADEMATTKKLAGQLQSVSQKLATTEIAKDKALARTQELTALNDELSTKLQQSERNAFALEAQRNAYMYERHAFANIAQQVADQRNLAVDRLNTVIQTVSNAHENAKRGITAQHPHGVAIA